MISFHSQSVIEAGLVMADALISIVGTYNEPAAVDADLFGGCVLRLMFDDIPWSTTWRGGPQNTLWTGPTYDQVAEAIDFARNFAGLHIAVHCLQGQSRSTAIALAVIADRCGSAADAVSTLIQISNADPSASWPCKVGSTDIALAILDEQPVPRQRPRLRPNPGIVRHAETLLGMTGQLDTALIAECADYVWWRALWVREGWR